MRLLIAATRYAPDVAGGVESRLRAMALAGRSKGHDIAIIATKAFCDLPSGPVDDMPVARLAFDRARHPAGRWAANCYYRAFRQLATPDAVWTPNAAMGVAALACWPAVPVLFCPGEMEPVGFWARVERFRSRWRQNGFRYAAQWWEHDALVEELVSKAWRTAMPAGSMLNYVAPQHKDRLPSMRVLPRGVNVAEWRPYRLRRRPSDGKSLRVLVACRLEKRKNVEQVIEAVALCRGSGVTLTITGSGPHEVALRRLVSELDLEPSVTFEGFRSDVGRAYADADVFVMSSDYEPFGNTVLEALACGCPVIIRRPAPPQVVIGSFEAVNGGPACLTFDTFDTSELAQILLRLCGNELELARMSQAATDVAERFDWSDVIHHYLPE